ncbi:MAG: NAD(P)-dependent glycerol-3-phosphate dehydrogenase [Alphaproteobacteria bacterium]|nr:NAD(P)-dependent glycerol-3-phosphate dehydrogenase [Alphaproteobacteria bacterium]
MTSTYQHFGVIGAGAWGTALAQTLKRTGRNVTLWAREGDLVANLAQKHENTVYLPGIRLDPGLQFTASLADLAGCDALILAVPAQFLRAACKSLAALNLPVHTPLIVASKGIEQGSHRLMSEVAAVELPGHPVYILSGPSFAGEVAQGLPAALTLASEAPGDALARAMSSPAFRLYTTDDIIGAQIGGAVKNVLAIACGIVVGRKLGDNARAALMTRGLAEIIRLGAALGARPETLMGLSGLGDVALTCSSPQSRNMSLGIELGEGRNLDEILASRSSVTEGASTASAAWALANHHGVDMPVVSAVDQILRERNSIDDTISNLLSRPLRQEAA